MTLLLLDPGSFRAPESRIFTRDSEVFRGLTEHGLSDYHALHFTSFFSESLANGRIIGTSRAAGPEVEQFDHAGYVAVLQHEVFPFISYPYELSFGMLRQAALLTLELTLRALDEGLIAEDASPYNVQFRGSQATFIDVGSFEPTRMGEPWYGYLQFCQQFLIPMMLQAYRGLDFHPVLRGSIEGIEGIEVEQATKLFTKLDGLRPGVLKHVFLHARLQRTVADSGRKGSVQRDLTRAGFNTSLIKANVRGLHRIVEKLDWKPASSEWRDYRDDNSCSDDDMSKKSQFVDLVCAARTDAQVWDLSSSIMAFDCDHLSVESLFQRLAGEGNRRSLPLLKDLVSPLSDLGWRHRERKSLGSRASADLVLALALVHHLAISRNVPLHEIAAWLADLSAEVVVEFPLPEDPQVIRLLRNKRRDVDLGYTVEAFEEALDSRFAIIGRELLPSGHRVLYHAITKRAHA